MATTWQRRLSFIPARFWGVWRDINLSDDVTAHEEKRYPLGQPGLWVHLFNVIGGLEFLFTLPNFWVPFIHWLWRIPVILGSSGLIAHELEDQTWFTYRSTPLTMRRIILAKYGAIFRVMEPHITLVMAIRSMPILVFGIAWAVNVMSILPEHGAAYWFSTTIAFLFSGLYLLFSPVLDVAFDGALGLYASSFARRRSSALMLAMIVRLVGFMIPLALFIPLRAGLFDNLVGLNVIQLRAIAVISTFGPAYAFIWGLDAWLSTFLVIVWTLTRYGIIQWFIHQTIQRAENIA